MTPTSSPAVDAREPGDDPLSWELGPETERWLAVLSYGQYAALLGLGLFLAVGALAAAAVALREGSAGIVLGALALVLVAGFARPPILAALRSESATFGFGEGEWQPSRRGLAVAAVVGAVAIGLGTAVGRSPIAFYAVAAALVGASLLAMALTTDASIDGDLRLETRWAAVDLRALSAVHTLDLGDVTVFWLTYTRGADGFRNPRVLAAPRERATEVRDAVQAGVDAPADADPIGRTERAVVALFGLGVLVTGPALGLLLGDAAEGGVLVAAYAGAFSLVFAGPMLWYALKG